MSEESQLKLRSAQSRLFATSDRTRILAAVIDTMQDSGFMVEVLEEGLGIVSGKLFAPIEEGGPFHDPTYHLHDDHDLLISTRTWGPFHYRSNVVRLTVTVRERAPGLLIVRANAQQYMRAVEDPAPYQRFFRALEQSLFLTAELLEDTA